MNNTNIIRAWKDQAYRNSLSPEERAGLPENPAGSTRLSAQEMKKIHGGVEVMNADFLGIRTLFRSRRFTCSKYHCAVEANA